MPAPSHPVRRSCSMVCTDIWVNEPWGRGRSLSSPAREKDLRELWETEEDQRLTGARFWVKVLVGNGPLRPGLS
jgi:hypothetical protein